MENRESSYTAHFSHALQDEADNFSSSGIDFFKPHKGHVGGEGLDVPENTQHTDFIQEILQRNTKWTTTHMCTYI